MHYIGISTNEVRTVPRLTILGSDHRTVVHERTAMRKEPDFLEVCALVCTIIATVLAIADWMLRLM
jgi:hypothetical protein